MSYRIVTIKDASHPDQDGPILEDNNTTFASLASALKYLSEHADVGVEYEIAHIVKHVKYEMKRVLIPLDERDSSTLVDQTNEESNSDNTLFSLDTEEESPSFAYEK